MSWDVHLVKVPEGGATFGLGAAKRVLRRVDAFREVEPGVGEIETDGVAEIFYGTTASSDMLVAIRVASPTVLQLIHDLATELGMVVFYPVAAGWASAIVGPTLADELPDSSWEGWERLFGLKPAEPVVYSSAPALAAVLEESYGEWERWVGKTASR